MKTKIAVLGVVLTAGLTISPAAGWQVAIPEEHAKRHPSAQAETTTPVPPAPPAVPRQAKSTGGMKGMGMMASSARLDELVKKMDAAEGQAKVDAIAELLTTLVQQHQSMHGDMGQMMSKTRDKHAGAAAK
jgi:hypothetical protein